MITQRRLREVIARRAVRAEFQMQLAGKLMGQRLHVPIPGLLRRFDGLVIELRSPPGIAVQSPPQFGFEHMRSYRVTTKMRKKMKFPRFQA